MNDKVDLSQMPEGAVPVLDHGYVLYVDAMGSDADIAAAARLSYGRGTKKVNKDEGLINYLYSHAHTSPFEMCEIKVQIRMPIFVMRQWVRHRMANLNEYSGRYSIIPELWYVPELDRLQKQSVTNRQGSSDDLVESPQYIQNEIDRVCRLAYGAYEAFIDEDVDLSRELARMVLPQNMYTEVVWKIDLNNMFKFLWLRDDEHSQWEIRQFAQAVAGMVRARFPLAYAAYEKQRDSVKLSQDELYAVVTGDLTGLRFSQSEKVRKIRAQIYEQSNNELHNLCSFRKENGQLEMFKASEVAPVTVAP